MAYAYITIGAPASGKSTWASARHREFDDVVICRDDIRSAIMNTKGLIPVWANWKWKWEKDVTFKYNMMLDQAISLGKNIICADTNLNEQHRANLIAKLTEAGYEVRIKLFPISFEEACKRDAARYNGVGYSVIATMIAKYEEQFGESRYVKPEGKRRALLVDIDGTVAKMKGRSPYEWDKVDTDEPNHLVLNLIKAFCNEHSDIELIFLSGRDGSCEVKTIDWLEKHTFYSEAAEEFKLYMRAPGDQRSDVIVKREIFDAHIRDHYDVIGVIDDRPTVCRMWRSLGLDVIQIGNPYVEF